MTCNEIRELISSMLDHELSPEDSAVVTEHLAECPECMRVFEAFHAISLSLEELEDVPEGFTEAVMHRIKSPAPIKKRRPVYLRIASLAACVAIILFTSSQFVTTHLHSDDRLIQDTAQYARIAHQTPKPTPTPTPDVTADIAVMSLDGPDTEENMANAEAVENSAQPTPEANSVSESSPTITPTPVPVPTATPIPVQNALLPTQLNGLNDLLFKADAADYTLYNDAPDYTVTVQDKDGKETVLFVWIDETRIYCKDPVNETAWYAIGTPAQLMKLLEGDASAPIESPEEK